MYHFGWHYNTKQIADFNNITINEAWNIPTVEALNTLVYLKEYDKYMATIIKHGS